MSQRALAWIVGNDVGLSSEAIWAQMMGTTPKLWGGRVPYPYDPDDFSRCWHLLMLIPEWRLRIEEKWRNTATNGRGLSERGTNWKTCISRKWAARGRLPVKTRRSCTPGCKNWNVPRDARRSRRPGDPMSWGRGWEVGVRKAIWEHERVRLAAAEILAQEHGVKHEAGTRPDLCPKCQADSPRAPTEQP